MEKENILDLLVDAVNNKDVDTFMFYFNVVNDNDFISIMEYLSDHYNFFKKLLSYIDVDMKDGILFSLLKNSPLYDLLVSNNPPISFNNKEDIVNYVDSLIANEKDVFIYPVEKVYDYRELIKAGVFPSTIKIDNLFTDYVNGMSEKNLRFWYQYRVSIFMDNLRLEKRWVFNTLETYKTIAIQNASSFPLMLYDNNLVYKSKRPKNDMAMYRNVFSIKMKKSDIIDNQIKYENEMWNVIPVTRYAHGMQKGLFFDASDDHFCGTFYYFEPESTTYLAYKTVLDSFNKYTAVYEMDKNLLAGFRPSLSFIKYIDGDLPPDLMFTPDEYMKVVPKSMIPMNRYAPTNNKKHYNDMGMYAYEDELDQSLCTLGKQNNYDIIVLRNMPGQFQVVTEILDTRDRVESFRHLIYIED